MHTCLQASPTIQYSVTKTVAACASVFRIASSLHRETSKCFRLKKKKKLYLHDMKVYFRKMQCKSNTSLILSGQLQGVCVCV